jgi:hypothetical protein
MARRSKAAKAARRVLPARRLLLEAVRLTAGNWRFFGVLILIHVLLLALLALDPAAEATPLYALLLHSVLTLAEIYGIRQLAAGQKPAVADSLYKGTAQFVPFMLFGLLFSLQLLPLAAGLWLVQVVVLGGVVVGWLEQAGFIAISLALAAISWHWLAVSLPGFYVVSLNGVRPMEAWHAAKRLAAGRHLLILRRVGVLLLTVMAVIALLLMPLPEEWLGRYNVLAIGLALLLPFIHTYIYKLYRSLI